MRISDRFFWLMAAFILLAGTVLRVLAARGDLWLDEISTVMLVRQLHSPHQVFLLAYDNNHFLNSLYLYFVDPNATPLVQRAFSIVLGVATIVAAGVTLAPAGRGAALLAMLLFAISFPMVNYGSEARGYAGLILCTVLAIHYLDKELREGGQRWKLAITIFFGLLFHMATAETVFALGLYVLADRWRETKNFSAAFAATVQIFAPTIIVMFLVIEDIAMAAMASGKVAFGALSPFRYRDFVSGFGDMIMATIGQLEKSTAPVGIILALFLALTCFLMRKSGNRRWQIYSFFLLSLPLFLFIVKMPNAIFCRYYLPIGIAFLLCLADIGAVAWRKNYAGRVLILCAIITFLVQNAVSLQTFLHYGRSHYADLVRAMTIAGPTTYGSIRNNFLNSTEIEFYSARQNVSVVYVPEAKYCKPPPVWLVAAIEPSSPPSPAAASWGVPDCNYTYNRVRTFPAWGMSGLTVTLYQRVNE